MSERGGSWFTGVLGVLAALSLSILPLPDAVAAFRPEWLAMLLLYRSLLSPHGFGLLTAFVGGLALDALTGSLLGQHALALLVIVYVAQRFHLRVRAFPASQLFVTAVALLGVYEFMLFWIDGATGRTVPGIERWAPVVSGALIWMFALTFVERGRQHAQARL